MASTYLSGGKDIFSNMSVIIIGLPQTTGISIWVGNVPRLE